jgi:hypothetical protein
MTSTMRPAAQPRTWDFLLTGFLIFLELLLVVVFIVSAIGFGFLNSGCTVAAGCGTTRIQFGQQICTFVPPLIAAVTIPWGIVRVVRRKVAFWLPLVGAVLMTIAFFIGNSLMQSGIPA